jgi:hypothetical protein
MDGSVFEIALIGVIGIAVRAASWPCRAMTRAPGGAPRLQ